MTDIRDLMDEVHRRRPEEGIRLLERSVRVLLAILDDLLRTRRNNTEPPWSLDAAAEEIRRVLTGPRR